MSIYKPKCSVLLIGSLPFDDHGKAVDTILNTAPDYPTWPQLPIYPKEGMIRQFLTGMPGLLERGRSFFINGEEENFEMRMAEFYENYFRAVDDDLFLKDSRFALDIETATGFFTLCDEIKHRQIRPIGIKGHVTGPITTGIGVTDHNGRNIFFNDNLKDMVIKLLALKSKWQVQQFNSLHCDHPPIIFIDEPGIVSFGSSAYISISREMVISALQEIIDAIHSAGGLAGIHICANGDFSLALESDADAISFDAYSHFDNVMLYKPYLLRFLEKGGLLAWGIVPTLDTEAVDKESTESLMKKFNTQLSTICNLGIAERRLLDQTFVAPACGAGALNMERALKVLKMTHEISRILQKRIV